MASTFACVYYHVVFSTKDRCPHIDDSVRSRLHEYIGGIVRRAGGIPVLVGGTADHVHVLFAMKTEPSVAAMVGKIKANSSKWVHETFPALPTFAWQKGYGVFSVSKSNTDEVERYIARQEEHHRRRSFQEEFLGLLQRHGIDYDERYVWSWGVLSRLRRSDRLLRAGYPALTGRARFCRAFGAPMACCGPSPHRALGAQAGARGDRFEASTAADNAAKRRQNLARGVSPGERLAWRVA